VPRKVRIAIDERISRMKECWSKLGFARNDLIDQMNVQIQLAMKRMDRPKERKKGGTGE